MATFWDRLRLININAGGNWMTKGQLTHLDAR